MRAMKALVAVAIAAACDGNAAAPGSGPLAIGRWTGDGACLTVADNGCNLAAGCGHGQFPRPILRADGTFDADGTYRIEVGPISVDPAPPAHFLGSVVGSRLMLTVMPAGGSLKPASFTMTATAAGNCPTPCV